MNKYLPVLIFFLACMIFFLGGVVYSLLETNAKQQEKIDEVTKRISAIETLQSDIIGIKLVKK